MAKKKLKIDQLAKLRQFAPGMDVEKFLASEYRQVIRAIEQAYVETDDAVDPTDLSAYSTTAQMNAAIAAAIAANTSTGNSAEWVAFNNSTISSSGDIFLTQRIGSIGFTTTGYNFKPNADGVYWVDAGCEFNSTLPGSGTFTSTLSCKRESGTLLSTSIFEHQMSGSFDYVTKVPGRIGVFEFLTTGNGVKFDIALSAASIAKFNVKITRVADFL